jgi:hypothetical protein
MRVHIRVIAHMAVNPDMLNRRIRMHVDDSAPVSGLGQAGSDSA